MSAWNFKPNVGNNRNPQEMMKRWCWCGYFADSNFSMTILSLQLARNVFSHGLCWYKHNPYRNVHSSAYGPALSLATQSPQPLPLSLSQPLPKQTLRHWFSSVNVVAATAISTLYVRVCTRVFVCVQPLNTPKQTHCHSLARTFASLTRFFVRSFDSMWTNVPHSRVKR